MKLLTLLGFDPAPVAWAAKVLRGTLAPGAETLQVLMVEEGAPSQNREHLRRWLEGNGWEVHSVSWPQAEDPGPDTVVNLTAGTKEGFFRLYWIAERHNLRAFVLDAHASPPLLAWTDGRGEHLPESLYFSWEDYFALYLEPQGARLLEKVPPSSVPKGLRGPTWYRVELEGEEMFFAVSQGRPWVYAKAPKGRDFKDHLNLLARRAKDLGGQLARAFTGVPPGRPQNANDRATLLQQAKEAGVELVFGDAFLEHPSPKTPSRAGLSTPTILEAPFSLPDQGPVLLGLVSEQPVPILASFLAHDPKWVYLVSTQDLEKRWGRLRAAKGVLEGMGARVEVATVPGLQAMGEVEDLFCPVVEEALARKLPVVANLNGGTKVMVLGLLRALGPGVGLEYLRGKELLSLREGSSPLVPWGKVGPQEVLRLYGYRLQPPPEWRRAALNPVVLARAEELLKDPQNPSRVTAFLRAWRRAFRGLEPNLGDKGKALGMALEYAVYYHLTAVLARVGGRVAPPGHLVPQEPVHNPREVDGVFWLRGSLGFVECKPKLRDALNRHHEDASLWLLQERFGGLFGKGILVVRQAQWHPQDRLPAKLGQVLANPNLRLFSLQGRQELGEGTLWAFPEDLEEALSGWWA
ncbi:MAG: hypothetical protein ACK4G4_08440 [Thermus sp.]|uniref:hypothetical protein n=1 Tax=Thermus sp. TaxID=275 RepID=UPI00391AEB17